MTIPLKVLVAVANGSEDIETITIIDVLRRANNNVTIGKVKEQNKSEDETLMTRLMMGNVIVNI